MIMTTRDRQVSRSQLSFVPRSVDIHLVFSEKRIFQRVQTSWEYYLQSWIYRFTPAFFWKCNSFFSSNSQSWKNNHKNPQNPNPQRLIESQFLFNFFAVPSSPINMLTSEIPNARPGKRITISGGKKEKEEDVGSQQQSEHSQSAASSFECAPAN